MFHKIKIEYMLLSDFRCHSVNIYFFGPYYTSSNLVSGVTILDLIATEAVWI